MCPRMTGSRSVFGWARPALLWSFVKRQLYFSGLASGGLIQDFDGEFQGVALAHETRRIRLTIRSLAVTVWPSSRAEVLVMREAENLHWVSASGMVNSSFTTPLVSEINCGRRTRSR